MPKYTKEQQQAIYDDGKDILVSASAGSGKTSVLVERVMQKIYAGVDLDQLLIITFTKAAASEMKNRIKDTLLAKIAQGQTSLKPQLLKVDTANISTIDAFCLDVIRRYYYLIKLDPSFSILTDEIQRTFLLEKALHEIEEEQLSKDQSELKLIYDNFAASAHAINGRDLLIDLYHKSQAQLDYQLWLKNLAKSYEIDDELIKAPIWQKQIKPYLVEVTSDLLTEIEQEQAILKADEHFDKWSEYFALFASYLNNYLTSLATDQAYDQQRALLSGIDLGTAPRRSKKDDEDVKEVKEHAKALKDQIFSRIQELFLAFYSTTQAEQLTAMKQAHQLVCAISDVEQELIDRFASLKREQNLIDFADMEQLAYQILSLDTTEGHLARAFYQQHFAEILVDEYQDINQLQQGLFDLLKGDQNHLFMVGDVKQSIYGFRNAEPSLFLDKYDQFEHANNEHERIILAENFRSNQGVIKFVNQVFNQVMTKDFGGLDYQKEAQLVYASQHLEVVDDQPEIHLLEKQATESEDSQEQEVVQTNVNEFDEVACAAEQIKQLVKSNFQVYDSALGKTRKIEYGDIAILTRTKSQNQKIVEQLTSREIPIFVSDTQNYFQTLELTIILNLLKIIDNPDQDIPLVAVLRSPIYRFTEPDLARIRLAKIGGSFYQALKASQIDEQLQAKVQQFLDELMSLRDFAAKHRISELIWTIYEQTNLIELVTAMPNGQQRRVNLQALYERANSYESAGFKGIYQFIDFITLAQKHEKDLSQPIISEQAQNSVQLMTIHGSKGLEFPVVFYLGLGRQFNFSDQKNDYIIAHDQLGITVRFPEFRADSLVKSWLKVADKLSFLEEESRIIYVALTRAKQKLIMFMQAKNLDKQIEEWSSKAGTLSFSDKVKATKPSDLILPVLAKQLTSLLQNDPAQKPQLVKLVKDTNSVSSPQPAKQEINVKSSEFLTSAIEQLFTFAYPFKTSVQTTTYQSASEINKVFGDPLDQELANSHLESSSNRYLQAIETQPSFLYDSQLTGAQIGTATHLVLQYYDYDSELDLSAQLAQLVEQGILSAELADNVSKANLNWFVNSDFAQKFVGHQKQLHREENFSSLIPATTLFEQFDDPAAKILVHGTIDGYFEEDDGMILFDYKTDHIDQAHLEQAIETIKHKYRGQLRLYEQALNELTANKQVKAKYLILLDAQKIVEI